MTLYWGARASCLPAGDDRASRFLRAAIELKARIKWGFAGELEVSQGHSARFSPAWGRVSRHRAPFRVGHASAQILAHARGMKPEPWPLPVAERHSAQHARVLVDPVAGAARDTRDLARVDQTLRPYAAGPQVRRETLNDTIGEKIGDPVQELCLGERLPDSPVSGARACGAASRALHRHTQTLTEG
jgi:hypothetical protein